MRKSERKITLMKKSDLNNNGNGLYYLKLLRKENLDLKLTPYKVLATSSKHGMQAFYFVSLLMKISGTYFPDTFSLCYRTGFVQFVESTALADVIKTDGSILNFFQKHAPSENSPLGVAPEIMDNYIKSLGEQKVFFIPSKQHQIQIDRTAVVVRMHEIN